VHGCPGLLLKCYAFDLIELNGDDLRRDPLEVRKATLASILAKARPSLNKGMNAEYSSPAHAAPLLAYNSQRSHAEPAGRAGNPVRLGMRRSSDS
jgi:hypothetical protein